MKIENAEVRVVKTQHATEVFVSSLNPYINFKFNLPPGAEIKSGDELEFAQKAAAKVPAKAPEPVV